MATIKQQRAVQKILENPRLPVGRAMIESGYSTNTAVHPSDLMRSKGFKELLDCYLPDDLLTSKLARNVKNKNGFISNHAIDIAFKIKNRYPASKLPKDDVDLMDEKQLDEEIKRLEQERAKGLKTGKL